MSAKYKYEADLYAHLLAKFQNKQLCFAEVPFFGKSVDLVLTTKTARTIIAIEVKLEDWRRALKQASINQLFACYSYIAVPEDLAIRLKNEHGPIFRNHGVGIIGVCQGCRIVLEAEKSAYIYPKHRLKIKRILSNSSAKTPKDLRVVTDALINGKRSLELLQAGAF